MERFSETYLIGTILVLHWVGIEDANHCPSVSLPQISVNRPEQEERHIHFQIMKIIQFPDAEGFPLKKKYKHVDDYTIFNIQKIRSQKWRSLTLFLLCGVILFITTAKVTQSLSSKLSLASRSGNWESLISLRLAIFCSMSMEDRRGFLQGNITHCGLFFNSRRNKSQIHIYTSGQMPGIIMINCFWKSLMLTTPAFIWWKIQ